MSRTKQEFALERIEALVDKVINTESIPKESQSYHNLEWIKFYAKELIGQCEDCKEAPHGSETEKQS